ncbi:MAG: nickel pincer cofactor biosynthesis protein LarC [Anaerolineales bacterium]|nr:nickel pincer cofactor biosynthesis protein LarC [Anaerolineales bacterium]
MANLLYLDLFSGASGDMLLGALVDGGLSVDALREELGKLALTGYALEAERKIQHGLSGTQLHVRDLAHEQPARHLSDVRALIEASTLSERVKRASLAVFERLGRIEAGIHGVPLDHVHFHEIGAVDSLVDIVGFAIGLELLGIAQVYASAVPLGSGTVETEHGCMPVPVPATLALLAEVAAPTRAHPAETEIVTPTAAAILAELALFERPAMRVQAVGYGFGQKEFPWANAVRAWIGTADGLEAGRDHVTLLECNLDDATGEVMGYALERLFEADALDVWFTPIQMKKQRPAVMLSVLAQPERAEELAEIMLHETTTLGVRKSALERVVAQRRVRQVETAWGPVRVKEKWLAGQRAGISPEYEDCARIARAEGLPLAQVYEAVMRATS